MAFDLSRFVAAQQGSFDDALAELTAGRKTSHWMWFVFPQIAGLGHSPTAHYYAIDSLTEARAYLDHPLLGGRLAACMAALMGRVGVGAAAILGPVDALKLRSSMTLFAAAADDPAPFAAVLDAFYGGAPDPATLALLAEAAA